jgi:hypothetical protein
MIMSPSKLIRKKIISFCCLMAVLRAYFWQAGLAIRSVLGKTASEVVLPFIEG